MKTYAAAFRILLVFVVASMAIMLVFFYVQHWNVSAFVYIIFTVLFLIMLTDLFRQR